MEPSELFAREAGLKYVSDHNAGFSRRRRGSGFEYRDEKGTRLTQKRALQRIRSLAIPPAWTDVWICPFENGHLQATGRDARGRKQYRYHPRWNETRNETKFTQLENFAAVLPRIRRRVDRELARTGLARERILAAVIRIMEETRCRVGNDVYAQENESFGLTTLRNRHATIWGSRVKFRFRGKSGVVHECELRDPKLAGIVRRCQDLPGEELFAYRDEGGEVKDVTSEDVNRFLREIAGPEITAKVFRTWAGTVRAAEALDALGPPEKETKKCLRERECLAVKAAARELGNTTAVCRKFYVHPAVLEGDRTGELHRAFEEARKRPRERGLSVAERAVTELIRSRARATALKRAA